MPVILEFDDYHDISYLHRQLKDIIPGIKAKEVGFYDRQYHGIFYIKQDKQYKKLIAEDKALTDQWDEEIQSGTVR